MSSNRPNDPHRKVAITGNIVLPDRVLTDGQVVFVNGVIEWIGPAGEMSADRTIDHAGQFVCPGFVDIHVHGGNGADYMDGTLDAVTEANRAHANRGTTSIFPTTTTGSPSEILAMIEACERAHHDWRADHGARIAGVHLYGPYFAANKTGCHAVRGCRDPDAGEYRALLDREIVRIATCAAELPGAADFYRYARAACCLVTCGHSDASWAEMEAAFGAGMRHVDHFWCAMSSVRSLRDRFGTPMQASMEQFVLATAEMSTEVIADGHHLSDELLNFAYRMIGPDRLCLVTDASRAMGAPPGQYWFGPKGTGALIDSDGCVGRGPDGQLASSVAGMDTMVRTMQRATAAPVHEVVRMATLTPAARAGVADRVGNIAAGRLADFVVLSDALEVRAVYIGGSAGSLG